MTSLILLGDVNLMNVEDPAVPFRLIGPELREADIVFANLECCLYRPPEGCPGGHTVEHEGFFADPQIAGEALRIAGIAAVGIANNVNYGSAAILGSIAALDRLGIAHTGAGANLEAASAPAVVAARRDAGRVRAAQLGLLADQPRGDRNRRRHRGVARPHGLSGSGAQDPARDPADEPARRAPDRRDLGRPRLSQELYRPDRGAAPGDRPCRRVVPLGARRGGARLHDRDRACRDRFRRRHRRRARAALFAAGRGLSEQADLLRARQLLVPHRARRQTARRLDRHDGADRGRPSWD